MYTYTCIYILHTILWLLIALVCLQIVKQTLCQSQYVTIFLHLYNNQKLCLNELRTTRSCQATFRVECHPLGKTERSKNSCGHCPLWIVRRVAVSKMPWFGGGVFFSLSKMMAVKPSHVGDVKLDEVLLEKGCTSFLLIHVFLYTCSGSFSTSSPECPVQSSLLACEYRVKSKTWVQWVTFDWLKSQQIVCFSIVLCFLVFVWGEFLFCFTLFPGWVWLWNPLAIF